MAVQMRVLRGQVSDYEGHPPIGYATATPVSVSAGVATPLEAVYDLAGKPVLTGKARGTFGPTTLYRPGQPSLPPGVWRLTVPATGTPDTNPSNFAYLVQTYVAGEVVASVVVQAPPGPDPLNVVEVGSVTDTDTIFTPVVSWADFASLRVDAVPPPWDRRVYVTEDWLTDENNPLNGGSLPAGVVVIQT